MKKAPPLSTTIEMVNSVADLPGRATKQRVILVSNRGDGAPALYAWRTDGWHQISTSPNRYSSRHDLSSQINGARDIFTLPSAMVSDTLQVFLGGLLMAPGESLDGKDFVILNSTQIQFHFVPTSGTNLLIYYIQEL